MKNPKSPQNAHAYTGKSFTRILVFTTLMFFSIVDLTAQSVYQPPQIAWGRYFDDYTHATADFANDDLADRIYYFENKVFVIGRTKSDSSSQAPANGPKPSGDGNVFLASYDPVCHTYNWVSYFGLNISEDYPYCAAFDRVGDQAWVYVAGEICHGKYPKSTMLTAQSYTTSNTKIFQKKAGDKSDAFIAKYNANTGELVRWTYVGGKDFEQILSLAVDTITHNVYFNGYTESPAWIDYTKYTWTPFKSDMTGIGLMFFGGLDSCLNKLKYFSYYGGNGWDRGHALEMLYANNTQYLVMGGTTQSVSGIVPPNSNTWDSTYGETQDVKNPDAFMLIWNVNTLSSPPDWCTYFGGSGIDRGRGISLTANNDIYMVGQTLSPPDTGEGAKFVPTPDAYRQTLSTRYDCFLTKFHIDSFNAPLGVHLELLTYFGGGKDDYAKSVQAFYTNNGSDGSDSVVIAGLSYSNDMASTDPSSYMLSNSINGNNKENKRDAFFAVLTKDPANPSEPQKLSSFAYLGGEYDETDVTFDTTIVQKSYNPGLALGPNGSVFIVYVTKGSETQDNGNIPVEYGAFHFLGNNPDSLPRQPDAYFAQVYPFGQNFIPDTCTLRQEAYEDYVKLPVRFFPVPFTDITNLDIFSDKEREGDVYIYDLIGNTILNQALSLQAGDNRIPLDLSAYPAGAYMCSVKVEGEYYLVKITKQ